jgi:hypothetical protein
LESQDIDLIVSNQSHSTWCEALEKCGFLKAQSNFVFAMSPSLVSLLPAAKEFHITRANGDGLPYNF